MSDLIRTSPSVCKRCKYHGGMRENGNLMCDYLDRMKRSRIFTDGELAYDPAFCDKFEQGAPVYGKKNYTVKPSKRKEEEAE